VKVRDIMTSEELATATLDTTLEEIANMMKEEDVGAIPILDEDENLAGIITDRDIVLRAIAEGQDPSSCTAEEILSEELHTIRPDADLEEAADLMARHRIRRLPVLEEGVIIGMISLGDISVKSEEDEAAEALEGISKGVKANDLQRAEGEDEVEYHSSVSEPTQERSGKQPIARGRQDTSIQGRNAGSARGADRPQSPHTQGATNRSTAEESRRQSKVAPIRAKGAETGKGRAKKKAS
jgi:CBS domain-containing protein